MKDEIKEILEDNDELMVRYKDNSFECFDTLPKNVLDYITNLQEENKKLKELCDKYEEEHSTAFNLWKTNIIKNVPALGDMQEQLKDYKSRIDKAIEWINYDNMENYFECPKKEMKELLNILGDKGEDKE